MKKTYYVPFSQITLTSAPAHVDDFFSSLLFTLPKPKKTHFSVDLLFTEIAKDKPSGIIEKSSLRVGKDFYILDTKQRRAKINFHDFSEKTISITVDPEFDLYFLYTFVIEPLLVIWSAAFGVAYLHASATEQNGKATVFCAWRNTGKTNQILDRCQNGHNFMGDDYCVLADKRIYLYPKTINVFSYNLRAFPKIFSSLPLVTSLRLKITMALKSSLHSFSQITTGSIAKILYRISELAEVSTNIKLSPIMIQTNITHAADLDSITILLKSGKHNTEALSLSKDTAIQKLLTIQLYELKDFFEIFAHYQFLFPETAKKVSQIAKFSMHYTDAIHKNISSITAINVAANETTN